MKRKRANEITAKHFITDLKENDMSLCDFCHKAFKSRGALITHIIKFHSQNQEFKIKLKEVKTSAKKEKALTLVALYKGVLIAIEKTYESKQSEFIHCVEKDGYTRAIKKYSEDLVKLEEQKIIMAGIRKKLNGDNLNYWRDKLEIINIEIENLKNEIIESCSFHDSSCRISNATQAWSVEAKATLLSHYSGSLNSLKAIIEELVEIES